MTTGRRPPERDRGQAAVEFALAVPVVVVLVLGIVQLVAVVRDQLAVELAARDVEGARRHARLLVRRMDALRIDRVRLEVGPPERDDEDDEE